MADEIPEPDARPTSTPGPSTTNHRRTPAAAVAIAWAVVAVPSLWGVAQTVRTSLRLFTADAPASPQPPAGSTRPAP
jgi:hypothetical protein